MTTAQIQISDAFQSEPTLLELVRNSESILQSEIDIASANFEWSMHKDYRNRTVLDLSIKDSFDGEAHASFAPVEMEEDNFEHFMSHLKSLKGALIQVGEWKRKVNSLFEVLQDWIRTYARKKWIINEEAIEVNERASGQYHISALKLQNGTQEIWVKPIAIWIVGAHGRVDVIGDISRFSLVLKSDEWHVVNDDILKILHQLDERVFHKILSAFDG